MIESVMFWNEPNNKSHWDFIDHDPDWSRFASMTIKAAQAVAAVNPTLTRVLGGISPVDAAFITRMERFGVLDVLDAVVVHGFPLDWNHWNINEWPAKIAEIEAVTSLPVWVSEVGVSTFGADEVQSFGLQCTHALLAGRVPRVHWYVGDQRYFVSDTSRFRDDTGWAPQVSAAQGISRLLQWFDIRDRSARQRTAHRDTRDGTGERPVSLDAPVEVSP